MNGLGKWLGVLLFSSFLLTACGGGGGGGGAVTPVTATLTGTITDSTLAPVAGATVQINDGQLRTTNAAGRYAIAGLSGGTYRLTFAGPSAEYFPASANVTLTVGKTTVLDLFLARATGQTVNAATGGIVTSETFIDAVNQATFNLAANELTTDGTTPFTGIATAYLTPIDVAKPGHGLATFQATLGSLFTALAADAAILETYGSAGLNLTDPAGAALSLVATPTSALTIPIPVALQAAAPPTPIDLWYLDTATGAWLSAGDTATLDLGGESYTGVVSRPGLWRAAVERTQAAGELTEISGTLLFNNGIPAGGATIYLNGTDHGYQNIATTSGTGTFALPAKTGGDFDLHFVVWANGAQWPHQQTIANLGPGEVNLGNIILPYAPPVAGAAAKAAIKIDSLDTNLDPGQLGYLLAAGRQISGKEDLLAVEQIADVVFLANDAPAIYGAVTLTPSQNGGGVQLLPGATFAGLTTAPTTGYFTNTNTADQYTIKNLETTTLPVLVAVKTAQGHYAKISIDAVTGTTATGWQVTFRHAFSLSGNF